MSNSLQNVWVFPSPQGSELLLVIVAVMLQDPPLWELSFLPILWIPGPKSGQVTMTFYWDVCPQSLYHSSLIFFLRVHIEWYPCWLLFSFASRDAVFY